VTNSYEEFMLTSSDQILLPRLRRADPDRFFCTLFAPAEARLALALLYLFNHELVRAREVASVPTLALIRLQWWREVVEGAERVHELAGPLYAALEAGLLRRDALLALIEAREDEDEAGFLDHARATGGRLAHTAGRIMGVNSPEIEDLGTAYAIAGKLRNAALRGEAPAAEYIAEAEHLLAAKPPRGAVAAWLPAAFARRDLRRLRNGVVPPAQRGVGDYLAVSWAALRERL
jgi:phytoene synthase